MRYRNVAAACAALAVVASIGAAAPAQAYDRDAYAYAAAHMIQRSDIPKELGAFKAGMNFFGSPGSRTGFVCAQPNSDPSAKDVTVKIPGGKFTFSASYNGRGRTAPNVNVGINQYATAEKAIKAFDVLKARIKSCEGTSTDSYTDDDGNTTTFSTLVTTGVVPSVSTLGVDSLFVNQNNLSESLPKGGTYISDSYTVYSLFNETIIQTAYYSGDTENLTTAQRKAVNKIAFNAEGRWVD